MTKLPIPLSPAKKAMVDAIGPTSNVPCWVARITSDISDKAWRLLYNQ
jgi:hypothetical protein